MQKSLFISNINKKTAEEDISEYIKMKTEEGERWNVYKIAVLKQFVLGDYNAGESFYLK